jgi:hypothetical protein
MSLHKCVLGNSKERGEKISIEPREVRAQYSVKEQSKYEYPPEQV